MNFPRVLQPGSQLDWNSPINLEHPINRGLIADFSIVTGMTSIRNLADASSPALATSAYYTGQGYTLAGYQIGPCEALPFPATSVRTGYAASQYLVFLKFVSKIITAGTFSAFVRKKNAVPATYIGAWNLGNSGLTTLYPHSDGKVYDDAFGTTRTSYTPVVPMNRWHHLIITADSSSRQFYQNGKLVATGSPGTFGINPNPSIGDVSNSRPLEGDIACICFHNRKFTASEAAWLHEEVRSGNPNRWNWINYLSGNTQSTTVKVPFHLLFSGAM